MIRFWCNWHATYGTQVKQSQNLSQVLVSSFNERKEQETPDSAAVYELHLDQILPKHFVKFNVRQQGKQITFILTPQLLTAMTLLISKREGCGVSKNNPFLFAKPDNSQHFLQGRLCTVVFINRSEAKNKVDLKALQFHKHMRIFQILSLTADELDQLAKQLGQNLPTDREHYQMPKAAFDISKIMELLSAMENGDLQRFEGRPFEEIEITGMRQFYICNSKADQTSISFAIMFSCFKNTCWNMRQMHRLPCVLFSFLLPQLDNVIYYFWSLNVCGLLNHAYGFFFNMFLLFPFEDKLEPEMEILEKSQPEKDDEESENTLQTHDIGDKKDGKIHSYDLDSPENDPGRNIVKIALFRSSDSLCLI